MTETNDVAEVEIVGNIVVIGLGLAVAVVSVGIKVCRERIMSDPDYVGGLGCLPEIATPLMILFIVAASGFWGVAGFILAILLML